MEKRGEGGNLQLTFHENVAKLYNIRIAFGLVIAFNTHPLNVCHTVQKLVAKNIFFQI